MLDQPRISVQTQSIYIQAQSMPENQRFVFAYTITIRNIGRFNVQLLRRYWLITNANGRKTEIQGEGVIGEKPLILSGNEYQYTSGAILETPCGTMEGYYEMVDHQGQPFRTDIPVFRLAIPQLIH